MDSPTIRAPAGMVCAVDHLAAQAGVLMLRSGGSAADAAVATSAVLAVTSQHICGMGGDLFAVVVPPESGRGAGGPLALNGSGRAGSGADPVRLRAEGHLTMPFRRDIRSVPVPGCVDGWLALHDRFGRLPLADVLEPARCYAADGFPASPTLAAAAALVVALPEASDYVGQGPGPLRPGTIIRRPGVARTLEGIARGGRAAFYQGEFGEGLLALGAGEFDASDLAGPLADWTPALGIEAWGHRIWTTPPNSQGYLTLAAAWLAAGLDLPVDPSDPQWAHLLVESALQASFDRPAVLHAAADGNALLDPGRLAPRRTRIDPERAWSGAPGGSRAGDTIALCAVDRDRMGITIVQSNASGFGSYLIVPGVRIFLHNRGIGFSLQAGHPNEYGPGRRPAHTLSPAAVTSPDGSLQGVLGTMGGDGQPQILLQVLARWLVAGEDPGTAVSAGRWLLGGGETGFDTWSGAPVRVVIEGHAPAGWPAGLDTRGHTTATADAYSHAFGHAHLITVEPGHLAGATDPRPRFGAAAGY